MKKPHAGDQVVVEERFSDDTLNVCLDTLAKDRQVIVFVSSKRAAESQAEKVAAKVELSEKSEELEKGVLKALSSGNEESRCINAYAELLNSLEGLLGIAIDKIYQSDMKALKYSKLPIMLSLDRKYRNLMLLMGRKNLFLQFESTGEAK